MSAPSGETPNQQTGSQQPVQQQTTPQQSQQTQQQQTQPPAQPQNAQDQNQFFATMTETLSKVTENLTSLPEQVANAVREATPQQSQTPPDSNAGIQTGNSQPTGVQPQSTPSNLPQSQQSGGKAQAGGKRTFADWWFGGGKS